MLSERKWRFEEVIRFFCGFLITSICFALLFTAVRPLLTSSPEKNLFDMLAGAFSLHVPVLIWAGIFLWRQQLTIGSVFGIRRDTLLKAVGFGVLFGLAAVPIAWMLQLVSAQVLDWLQWNPQSQQLVKSLKETTKTTEPTAAFKQLVFGISVMLLAPPAEEVLFRGVIYPTIKNFGWKRTAACVSAIIFGFMHFNMASFIPLTLLGFLFVFLYEQTDNLLAPIVAHSVFNGSNFLYMLYEKQINQFLFPT